MLLAIDVGNTQTVLGLFEDSALGEEWRISTEVQRTGDELGALLETLLRARDLCLGRGRRGGSLVRGAGVEPRV